MHAPFDYDRARSHLAEISDSDVELIRDALDTFIRVHLGQLATAFEPLIDSMFASDRMIFEELGGTLSPRDFRRELESLQQRLTGSPHGGPGVGHPVVSNEARRALNLLDSLRGEPNLFPEDGSTS